MAELTEMGAETSCDLCSHRIVSGFIAPREAYRPWHEDWRSAEWDGDSDGFVEGGLDAIHLAVTWRMQMTQVRGSGR